MKEKRVSIKDIANEIGTSITTVSLILNGKGEERKISKSLIDRVLKLVEERNYQPNLLAKSLRTGKTNTIALLVEDISNQFFSGVARLVDEFASKSGYKILYSSTENDPVRTRELIDLFRARHVDGFIICPPEESLEDIKILQRNHIPLVLFDRYFPGNAFHSVVVDNFSSTRESIKHLVNNGYKNIAFVTIQSNQIQMKERLDGYLKVIQEFKYPSHIYALDYSDKDGKNVIPEMIQYFNSIPDLDAVFFATNYLGVKGIEVIQSLKKIIGKEIGVVSFDDHDLFRLYSPSISSIAQPTLKIAESIIGILIRDMERMHSKDEVKQIKIPTHLTIRNSSKRD
jgi:LacI family transcriptional regulator